MKALGPVGESVLASIASLSEQLKAIDREILSLCNQHPETELLRAVPGVGPVTALTYVLTIAAPSRFKDSRAVGSYLGLRPRQDQSGSTDKQLRITKAGDTYLRQLLAQSAHHILGPFGQDCDLRRWGLALATRGGRNGKKRAVTAVARKLAVLLHALWKRNEKYDPLRAARLRGEDGLERPAHAVRGEGLLDGFGEAPEVGV